MTAEPVLPTEAFAKDAIIAWFRGEFAAANAIIDALCSHVAEIDGSESYKHVFESIHRRRLNWIPILQMQKYFSVTDSVNELKKVAQSKKAAQIIQLSQDHPKSDLTHTGSEEHQVESRELCSKHEECESRCSVMKMTKGFIAKEHVKGHMVNVVRGLKLYEDVFTDLELCKLNDFVSEVRVAGRSGELSGETYISYKQQTNGNKRELIQLGAPIFEPIKEEAVTEHEKSHLEPIPALLHGVIDHLLQWHLISENRKPNSCVINFFDEGESSQPFLKPPHLDQPISTLLLSESKMAFGRTLISEKDGNYRGPLMLSLKEGALLVMRGHSSDMARHVMCATPNRRVSITFFRVRMDTNQKNSSLTPHPTNAMTLWQGGHHNGALNSNDTIMRMAPRPGLFIRTPMVMLAPMVMSPREIPTGGTGVFLPCTAGSRKPAKHLPPRAQKRRFLSLPSPSDSSASDVGIRVEG